MAINSLLSNKDKEKIAKFYHLKHTFSNEIPKGLGEMFYHTLSYEGDKTFRDEMLKLKQELETKNLIIF